MEETVGDWLSLVTVGYLPDDVSRNFPLLWLAASCWCESILERFFFPNYKNSDYSFPFFVRLPRHSVYFLVYVHGANVVAISFLIRCRVFCVLHRVEEVNSPQRFDEPPASFDIDSFFIIVLISVNPSFIISLLCLWSVVLYLQPLWEDAFMTSLFFPQRPMFGST
jgi:hypothetical protein